MKRYEANLKSEGAFVIAIMTESPHGGYVSADEALAGIAELGAAKDALHACVDVWQGKAERLQAELFERNRMMIGLKDERDEARRERDELDVTVKRMREAMDLAKAACWDAYYGRGIALEYVRKIDEECRATLSAGSQKGDA